MVIDLNKNISRSEVNTLLLYLKNEQVQHTFVERLNLIVVPKIKQDTELQLATFNHIIHHITPTTKSYPLASKEHKASSLVNVDGVIIGGNNFVMMAGPCSVESEEQIYQTAAFLSKNGVQVIRGGAYKPRTSPYSFQGLGLKGLQILSEAAKTYNLKVVTEVMDVSLLDEVSTYSDMLQVGSRNMQNFHLLKALGNSSKPVLLKRGMYAKVNEWLLAAEYILSGGNEQVVMCERGIRSFDSESRNVMDIGVIPIIKELSHLPIIADPSHGSGLASRVTPLSLASAAAGADGLLIEVHPNPSTALSDKQQAIDFKQFEDLNTQLSDLLKAIGKPHQEPMLNVQTL